MTEPQAADEIKPTDKPARIVFTRGLSLLNKPFAITVVGGVIAFLITSYVQQRYWIAQQDYLYHQESMKFKLATIDETIKSVDKLLSAYSDEFTAYESDFDQTQKLDADRELTAAVEDWDKESDLRKLRIQLYFPDPEIQKAWEEVDNDLGTLDCYMMRLGTNKMPQVFGCQVLKLANLSPNDLIVKGRPNIKRSEEDLQKLAKLMVDAARRPH